VKSLVVYESLYGNTKTIAEAIGEGLDQEFTTEVVEVGAAPANPSATDLLVVGGPTHQFGLSRKSSRQQGADDTDGPVISLDLGIREWIEDLPRVSGALAATFDTSIRKPNLPGSAARGAARRLKKLGYRILVPGELFLVEGGKGPITDGEVGLMLKQLGADRWVQPVFWVGLGLRSYHFESDLSECDIYGGEALEVCRRAREVFENPSVDPLVRFGLGLETRPNPISGFLHLSAVTSSYSGGAGRVDGGRQLGLILAGGLTYRIR
jgi:hypothetical protein